MSDFISGVANPMTSKEETIQARKKQMEDKLTTFMPPPSFPNPGIFAPGYGKKDNTVLFIGMKPNHPMRNRGTKIKKVEASVD